VKASANQIRQALTRPRGDIRFHLLHGPDEAGAGALAALLGGAMGSDAERVDLDGATLRADPARLADEAVTMSLFGDKRWIRVTAMGEESVPALAALLEVEAAGNPVVAIAPSVRAISKLVKMAIDSPRAMAFACYQPSAQDLERLAGTMAGEQGLRLATGVAARLVEASGGDRAVLAQEIEKCALFLDAAADLPRDLDAASLDAIGADLDEGQTTAVVDAMVEGQPDRLAAELARLADAGTSPIPWLRQLTRRLMTLADMRGEIALGEAPGIVMKRHRVFFREEEATARALSRWSPSMLAKAIDRVRAAERAVMSPGNAGGVLAEEPVLTLSRQLARRG
jgi:DNA polymerase-3 subunit delta